METSPHGIAPIPFTGDPDQLCLRCTRCASTITNGHEGIVVLTRGKGPRRLRVLCHVCVVRPDERHSTWVPLHRYFLGLLLNHGLEETLKALQELNGLSPDVVMPA